jgi:hypothetical protein
VAADSIRMQFRELLERYYMQLHDLTDYSPLVFAPMTYSVLSPRMSRALAFLLSSEVGISSVLTAGARRSTIDAWTVRTTSSS